MGVMLPAALDTVAQRASGMEMAITQRFQEVDTANSNSRLTNLFVDALNSVETSEVLDDDNSYGDDAGPLLRPFVVEEYGRLLTAESPHANPTTQVEFGNHINFITQKVPASLKAAVVQTGFRSKGARVVFFFLHMVDSLLESDDEFEEEDEEEDDEEDEEDSDDLDEHGVYLSMIE